MIQPKLTTSNARAEKNKALTTGKNVFFFSN
jgi:hypothetical protein